MKTIIGIFLAIALSSCTYTINLVHTEGSATDTIDDTATTTPNVSPNITALQRLPL